ncbi:hypothetical protein OXX80_001153 [Metschnikowia pulcherrima]|uniref:Uncharacterized protein n=1 Tax=Metschnikowia aff. pulcherrima TaxID=2163413 RepID=A0A4P6XPU8_9ASCO|nr:hypothetical protein METSCH_B09550 [Metschnikowia aff. pulcherrima]
MSSELIYESSPLDDYSGEEDSGYYSETESEYDVSAQEQWDESIKQITGLVNFVIFPLLGKLLGRRTAHIIWRKVANWWF